MTEVGEEMDRPSGAHPAVAAGIRPAKSSMTLVQGLCAILPFMKLISDVCEGCNGLAMLSTVAKPLQGESGVGELVRYNPPLDLTKAIP